MNRTVMKMARQDEYKASLTREQFLFYEIRVVAKLRMQGETSDGSLKKVLEDNLFQFPTERMIVSIFHTCQRRLDALESDKLVNEIAFGSAEDAKLINLYSMMRDNRIVWDFMVSVIGEKYRTQDYELTPSDLNIFFLHLQEQNDQIAAWSDSTVRKIKQVLKRCLLECGYLESAKSTRLAPVFPCPILIAAIRQNRDTEALAAFNSFS